MVVNDAIKLAYMWYYKQNDDLCSVLMLDLWSSRSWATVTKFKGGCSWISYQNTCCLVGGVLLCNCYQVL